MSRKYGWRRDYHDDRDLPAAMPVFVGWQDTDLRPRVPQIFDQGNEGSCVANACALAAMFCIRIVPSRQFLYWNARKVIGEENNDSGCQIRDAVKIMASIGIPPERAWPYHEHWNIKPSDESYREAKYFTVHKYTRVNRSASGLCYQLTRGIPVVVGISVFESFESQEVADTGIVPLPSVNEQFLGGHAVLVVGSTRIKGAQYWICANSWGPKWGDEGFFYLPSIYLTGNSLSNDFWSIETIDLEGIQ